MKTTKSSRTISKTSGGKHVNTLLSITVLIGTSLLAIVWPGCSQDDPNQDPGPEEMVHMPVYFQ